MYKVGIVGGSGYTAGELLRLLIFHPYIDIACVYSTTQVGKKITEVHGDLLGLTELTFSGELSNHLDVLFLCLGHGNSKTFLANNSIGKQTKVIDLSTDFRHKNLSSFNGKSFVYGLPELNRDSITKAKYIANPGCFATAIQLALLPMANARMLSNTVHIHALTGSTGAGTKLSPTSHFSYRDNNVSWYKAFDHQHLTEIGETLKELQGEGIDLKFIPIRGNFSRGIFATLYTPFSGSLDDIVECYKEFYKTSIFTQVSKTEIHLKQVVNTNNCFIHLTVRDGQLLITSIIDNLLKGASGQAVQNMNLMLGLDEYEGLKLKANYF